MTDSELTAAYRHNFADTEDEAVRRMRTFVEKLMPAQDRAGVHRTRWMLPAGVAAAVAAVAITTVSITAGSDPVRPAATAPAGAVPATTTAHTPRPPATSTMTPSPTASSPSPATRPPRSTAPDEAASRRAAAVDTPPPATTPVAPRTTIGATTPAAATDTVSTYPALGDPGITGPLTPYARADAYTKTPKGLAARPNADDISFRNDVTVQFTMYITTPNPDPKVVNGGYLVMVAAPSVNYRSMDGQGPSTTPTGAAVQLGDRRWRWNTEHTVLISTNTDADIYIGVLATRAANEFEPTIPHGYTSADIELIASGLHT